MSNNLEYTTVTVRVKKFFDSEGKPTCIDCIFHTDYINIAGDAGRVCLCTALDKEIGSAYDLKNAFTPLKNCPIHYSEVTKELLK